MAADLPQEKFLSPTRESRVMSPKPSSTMGNTWQVPSYKYLDLNWSILGWGRVSHCVQRQQALKEILCSIVINSNTTVHNLAIRQVIRILQCSADGKRRIQLFCWEKNNCYVEDHLAAVNNSAQYPQELLLSGWGENEPLNATSEFSHGISGKSTCTHLTENTFLFACFPSLSQ